MRSLSKIFKVLWSFILFLIMVYRGYVYLRDSGVLSELRETFQKLEPRVKEVIKQGEELASEIEKKVSVETAPVPIVEKKMPREKAKTKSTPKSVSKKVN